MIRRLRWKVVGLNMGMVFCVLLAVFAAVFFFARSALSRSVRQQMEEAVRTGVYDLSQPDGSTLPCFVAEVYASGTVRVSGNGYYDLTDKSALADIVTAALSAQEDEGVLADYHLRYLRSVGLLSTRIAFTDSTLEQATLRGLLTGSLLIGFVALAVLFACFCVLASFGMGNMSQINSIAGNLQVVFRVPPVATGIVLALLTGRVILGGLKRVAAVTEAIVPLMALFYLFGALTVVCVHWAAVPAAFAAIFRGAFGLQAAGGGVLGYGMARAISWGFKRGAFSNEAGLGASVLVHCAANVEEPVQQGMWGMFEVFADTMVVCTLTALVVLTSGLVDLDTGAALTGVKGSALVGQAFSTVFGAFGPQFIAVSVLLFAYSTTLGWSHYGTRAVVYLLGERAAAGYKLVFAAMVLVGAVMKLDLAWALSDTFNGLMMLPNLVGVVGLSGVVVRETQAYLKRK